MTARANFARDVLNAEARTFGVKTSTRFERFTTKGIRIGGKAAAQYERDGLKQ